MTFMPVESANRIHAASVVGCRGAVRPPHPTVWIRTSPVTHAGSRAQFGLLVCALITVLAAGCVTTMPAPPDFLQSENDSWNQWMDKVVDVQLTDVRIAHLPLTDAFLGVSIVIARADAPVRSLPVTLHARQITRRQALWLISKRYGLKMTVESIPGQPPYIGIASR